jgi:EAL domain-containing protein (putative c-di-GMP-specific phosphodiesterase class I)
MSSNPNRLLVLDDHADMREYICEVARGLGFEVAQAENERTFRNTLGKFDARVIVLDLQMPGQDGIEVLRWLGRQRSKAAILIISGMDQRVLTSTEDLGRTYGLNMAGALQKPVSLDDLEATLTPLMAKVHRFVDKDVQRAIDRAQLRVHYQPKVQKTTQGWEVSGAEALLRWEHPEHGMVYPDEFIGLAEQHGLIGALTDYVLQSGIEQLGAWNQDQLQLNLAVNLSPKLVTDVDFPDRLGTLLAKHAVGSNQLTIEVTETATMAEPDRTLDILTRLRVKGIGLSLDDFGTGHSSLTQLYKMPFNEIKIDKSLGMDLPQTREARSIVRGIIDLAHNLGLTVCCEGVENGGALAFLHESGCDSAQGYFLAKPMAPGALPAWVRSWTQLNAPVRVLQTN